MLASSNHSIIHFNLVKFIQLLSLVLMTFDRPGVLKSGSNNKDEHPCWVFFMGTLSLRSRVHPEYFLI